MNTIAKETKLIFWVEVMLKSAFVIGVEYEFVERSAVLI